MSEQVSQQVWRFPLKLADRVEIQMPTAAQILSVHVQAADSDTFNICLWAICQPDAPKEWRNFVIVGTGHPMPYDLGRFIGTVLMPPFVWHVFEVKP